MSTIKVQNIQHTGSSTNAIALASDGTCTANITNNLSNRNVIINGAALVAQRGDTLSGTTTGGYATDRFQCVMNETGTLTVSQDSSGPSGFSKSHRLTQTTAQGSLAANDLTTFRYNVEGFDVQRFKKGTSDAQQFTLSFFVRSVDQSSYPVTYIVELRDPINTRSCCKSYTVTASDTWEYKTLTFPADTTGTWAASNTKALEINWFVAAGSNYTSGTLSTSWASTVTANRAAGLTANLSANTANRFYLTGVQLEVGSFSSDFEFKSYAQELQLCKRYYQEYKNIQMSGYVPDNNARVYGLGFNFPVEMRAAPTLTISNTGSTSGQTISTGDQDAQTVSLLSQGTTTYNAEINLNVSQDLTDNRPAVASSAGYSVRQTKYMFNGEL